MSDVPEMAAYQLHEKEWESYDQLYEAFKWEYPDELNTAEYVCDRWADDKGRVAIFAENAAGEERTYTFRQLRNRSNQLANYLEDQGIGLGDRVAINLPQTPEAMIAYLAIWKLGAISVALSTLYGRDAVRYRLDDSGAKAVIVHESNYENYRDARGGLDIQTTLAVGDVTDDESVDFRAVINDSSRSFETAATRPRDDAMLFYTSGTTGDPKGVLHGHRLLLGMLPTFILRDANKEIQEEDVHWHVGDWMWMGALTSVPLPAMYYGRPVLAYDGRGFDPERAFELIEKYELTNCSIPPTGLRMMMQVDDPIERYDLNSVRLVTSGGEAVGSDITNWVSEVFEGAAVHRGFGQTEAHSFVADCTALFEPREDTMGRPMPGHEVNILDPETAEPIGASEIGEIGLRYEQNPCCLTEYWKIPERTAEKIKNGWLRTGDLGEMDEDGYISFHSRKDDVIISAGYRIGPEEIEESLAHHPAVADAGVIGIPDDVRGEVPKAFVRLADDYNPEDRLAKELQEYVKDRLAKYEYPREIEFLEKLPLTTTGKIRRSELREREGLS